jgi:hypothetical protein
VEATVVKARRSAAAKAAPKQSAEAGIPSASEGGKAASDGSKTKTGRRPAGVRQNAGGFACSHFDAEVVWKSMLESNDERIRLAAAKYLTDRLYGRAAQAVKVSGEMDHKITVVVDL